MEHIPSIEFHDDDPLSFLDKMEELLPGVNFEETADMAEARTAVLEALQQDQDPSSLQPIWAEYATICEQFVDSAGAQNRAQLQIAIIVHKSLIFRENGDMQRYGEELSNAEEYAFNAYLDDIVEAINEELNKLQRK